MQETFRNVWNQPLATLLDARKVVPGTRTQPHLVVRQPLSSWQWQEYFYLFNFQGWGFICRSSRINAKQNGSNQPIGLKCTRMLIAQDTSYQGHVSGRFSPRKYPDQWNPVLAKTSLARAKSPAFAHASKRPLYTTTSATTPACSMPRLKSKDSLNCSSQLVKQLEYTED